MGVRKVAKRSAKCQIVKKYSMMKTRHHGGDENINWLDLHLESVLEQPWAHLLALSFQGHSLESLSPSLLVLRTTRQLKNN